MKATGPGANRLVFDPASAGDLRTKLRQNPQAGLHETAQQFEAMLLNLMLKSMREATPSDGLLDSESSRFFTTMNDQQLAQTLAAQAPLGFAALIEKQLARQVSASSAVTSPLTTRPLPSPSTASSASPTPSAQHTSDLAAVTKAGATTGVGNVAVSSPPGAGAFVARVWPHAVEAAAQTGVPAHFLVAHSALESGWGRHEIRKADGSPSFNLFGIKAGRNWSGPTTEVQTTEVVNGVAQSTRAKFRAYGSYAEAFGDYAKLLSSTPRFAGVIGQQDGTQFARSLQQAGYATDPMYAEKLARIIGSSTLRQALAASGSATGA